MAKKKSAPVIAIVGGGSVHWSPTIINDLLLTDVLDGAEIRLFDVDLEAAVRMQAFSKMLAKKYARKTTFIATDSEQAAYSDAEYVIITISTGGFDAMRNDIEIPEKYGILQTVGDTVGPGGWNRGLRNIPVFERIACSVEKYSAGAAILNYSNPMAVLTQTLAENCSLRVTGLCHGILSAIDMFALLLDTDRTKTKVKFGGTNHFFFITDARADGKSAYPRLAEKLKDRTLAEYIESKDVEGFELRPTLRVGSEFYHQYGAIPYPADRHTCEFVSGYVNAGAERLEEYAVKRTGVDERIERNDARVKQVEAWISGDEEFETPRSRETAASIIEAFHTSTDLVDGLNLVNTGQISNLPKGVVVETLGVAGALGFQPCTYGKLPLAVAAMTVPHCINQQLMMKAATTGDAAAAYRALANDPLVSHLTPADKRRLFAELMKANRHWLPRGLK